MVWLLFGKGNMRPKKVNMGLEVWGKAAASSEIWKRRFQWSA